MKVETTPEEQLIVALDLDDAGEIKKVVRELGPRLRWVKIGSIPFFSAGEKILPWLKDQGLEIFLDLKFHDIPSVVSSAITICSDRFSPSLLTVHAAGGPAMFKEIRRILDESDRKKKPKVLGVTVLTSLQDEELQEMGLGESAKLLVPSLAKAAMNAGADGLVCSPLELKALRAELGKDAVLVTPGIRMETDFRGDQTRIATPDEAMTMGASYLVMGRPILGARDRRQRFEEVLDLMVRGKFS